MGAIAPGYATGLRQVLKTFYLPLSLFHWLSVSNVRFLTFKCLAMRTFWQNLEKYSFPPLSANLSFLRSIILFYF